MIVVLQHALVAKFAPMVVVVLVDAQEIAHFHKIATNLNVKNVQNANLEVDHLVMLIVL